MSCVGRRWGGNSANSANHHFLILLAVAAAAARGGVILHNDGLHQPDISTARAGRQPAARPARAGVHTTESGYN